MNERLGDIIAAARERTGTAPAVVAAITRQNAAWGASERRSLRLEALERGAVAVVTGQQLGLAGGPLYTLHKAASAIHLATELCAAGTDAVPIFWIQAEDHDFEEIRHVHWPGPDGPRTAALPERPPERARTSIAHEQVGPGIAAVLAELAPSLRASDGGAAFLAQLERHYRPGASMVEAFGGLVAEIFEPWGLLTVQPRDAALAELAAPIHRRAIVEHQAIAAELEARAAELGAAGRAAPIPVRSDCALTFLHPAGAAGPRYRAVPDGGAIRFSGGEGSVARDALLRRLDDDPLVASSSALLRPIVQDALLPTAAYVGGPAEVAYAEQIAPLYPRFGVRRAPFVRRASFVITDGEQRRDLAELGLTIADLGGDESALLQRLGRGALGTDLEALGTQVQRTLVGLRGKLADLDPGLVKTATKTEESIVHALEKLRGKAERAAGARPPERVSRVRRLRRALRPDGQPQERAYGLPAVAHLGLARIARAAVELAAVGTPGAGEVELAL